MTQNIDSKGDRLLPSRKFFLDRLWIWATGILFWAIGAVLLAFFTPLWVTVTAIWNSPLVLAEVQLEIAEMRAEVNAVSGDNRVIRQPPGLSYVTEPVHVGEPVVLNLVASRTELGARCILTSGQSLFTEAGGVITPGSEVRPGRQINEDQTRMRIRLIPPDSLRPGRIELYLALEYDCDGKTVFDRTETVVYQLLSSGR